MSKVTELARGPLTHAEALVMYATAAEGATRSELPAMTGLPDTAIEDALAQLVRRGLIHPTGKPAHQPDARPPTPSPHPRPPADQPENTTDRRLTGGRAVSKGANP